MNGTVKAVRMRGVIFITDNFAVSRITIIWYGSYIS
jgi:hypothetical protein